MYALPKKSTATLHPTCSPAAARAIAALEWLPVRGRLPKDPGTMRLVRVAHAARVAAAIERAAARFAHLEL